MFPPFVREMYQLCRLSWPILFAQVAQTSMGFVDTLVSGHAGTLDLAAVALGSAFWMPIILFGQGIIVAVMPFVARLRGQFTDMSGVSEAQHLVQQAIWLALFLALPLLAVAWSFVWLLPLFGYEPALTDMCRRYLLACSWGLPGYLLFVAVRCVLDGLGRVRVAMITAFAGLGLNVVGNIAFVLGKWGFPAYGGVGAGIATAIVCWSMAAAIVAQALCMPDMRRWLAPSSWTKPGLVTLRRLFSIGLPGACATLCEVTMFTAIAMLVAPLGPVALASNQITGSFSSMVFMVPLSLGMGTTIRVGMGLGAKSPDTARRAARAGMALSLCTAILTATCIILFHRELPRLFTDDPIVAASAAGLLIVTAFYQIPDALQVLTIGALRAYNDTRAIFVTCFATYWCLGVPLGYVLGRTHLILPAQGARGFWIAITLALTVAAGLLITRLRQLERKTFKDILLPD